MNFYPFHIGDYAAHTQRLSLMEDLAYRRLLDLYYLSEGPLAGDARAVAREIGMLDHLDAVVYVLGRYFEARDGAWHNARCDAEIDKYRRMKEGGRAAVERRWARVREAKTAAETSLDRPTASRNADDVGHLSDNATTSDHIAGLRETDSLAIAPLCETDSPPTSPLIPTKNQEPRTKEEATFGYDKEGGTGETNVAPAALSRRQRPTDRSETTDRAKPARATAAERPEDVDERTWADYLALRRAKRAPLTRTALDGLRREAGKAGMPLGAVLELCCQRGWQGFKAEWLREVQPGQRQTNRFDTSTRQGRINAYCAQAQAAREQTEGAKHAATASIIDINAVRIA